VVTAAAPVHAEPVHVPPRSPRRRRASQKSGPADQLLEEGGRTGEGPAASQLSDLLNQTLPVRSAASRYAHLFVDLQALGSVSLVPCSDPELLDPVEILKRHFFSDVSGHKFGSSQT
jgi:hypothetical protein